MWCLRMQALHIWTQNRPLKNRSQRQLDLIQAQATKVKSKWL